MSGLAEKIYRGIFANPKHLPAIHVLGTLLLQAGSAAEAELALRCAEQLSPRSPEIQNNLGLALARQGKLAEAIIAYDRALAARPAYPSAMLNKAVSLCRMGDPQTALALCDQALTLEQSADLYFNRGVALQALGRDEDAITAWRSALALEPRFPDALNNLGNALAGLGRLEEAIALLDRAVGLSPRSAMTFVNRAAILWQLRRFAAAQGDLDQAITLEPGLAEAWCNRGNIARERGDIGGALAAYERALQLSPGDTQAMWNRGMTRLLLGDWQRGWADYELRHAKQVRPQDQLASLPQWRGENLAGRRILLFSEQGLGDAIQFCRFAQTLAGQGAEVTLLAPARLEKLLNPLPGVTVVGELPENAPFDCWAPLMGLPRYLEVTPDRMPPLSIPYLKAQPERLEKWARRIGDAGLKVAIAWQGNPAGSIDSGRSIVLRHFRPLAAVPGVRLISVQRGFGLEQIGDLSSVETWPDMDDGPDAFLDSAAILAHCDLVVTSDTAIAHLAGALGRPTWLALKRVPDWRWLLDRADTPWYPGMRLYRQAALDDWASVFARMAADLASTPRGAL